MEIVPRDFGHYLAGFVDGEGSFNVSFRPREDYTVPWKVSLCFNVSQRERLILSQLKRYIGCGTMRQRHDGVWYYEVNNLAAICEYVIPFLKKFCFRSAKKKRDFSKFCKLAELLMNKKQFSYDGIVEILKIRSDMNDGGKRKYSDHVILERFKESSETIRQTPIEKEMI